MDQASVDVVRLPRTRADLVLGPGAVPLGGGTGIFADPTLRARELVDLLALGWEPATWTPDGLQVAATCRIAELVALAGATGDDRWRSRHLVASCARSLVASEKIWAQATVGGNVCVGLPAGAMTSLMVALDAQALVWTPDGGERREPVHSFVRGVVTTSLEPGEVLRALEVPADALAAHAVFRRVALAPIGRSGAIVTGRRDPDGTVVVGLTAGVPSPRRLVFDDVPGEAELLAAVDAVDDWYDDVHGAPDWRRAMSLRMAREVRDELAAGALAEARA